MVTKKAIEELKERLRNKHQRKALYDAMTYLKKIRDSCEEHTDYCKRKSYEPSRTVTENLRLAEKALRLIDEHKQNFVEELTRERPAALLADFDTEEGA